MDPLQFLDLARELARPQLPEASYRSAISRAYYAAHNFLADRVEKLGYKLPKAAAKHEKLCVLLKYCNEKPAMDAGSALDDLRSERNAADYDMDRLGFDANKAQFLISKAAKAIDDFKKANPLKVKQGIQDYLVKIGELRPPPPATTTP